MDLFGSAVTNAAAVADILRDKHYLGRARRGFAWDTELGVMVFTNPNSRHLPQQSWLELVRWCITGEANAGSQHWAGFARYADINLPAITTIVSYSDPSQGHTGALYRACNWLWAPTWHRLRPPPSGNGAWSTEKKQSVKDRWIFPLRPDDDREGALAIDDTGVRRDFLYAEYREPTWKKGHRVGGGGDYKRWVRESAIPSA